MEMNNDWLSNAVDDDAELWEALSADHCPQPAPLSLAVTITVSSHGEHLMDNYMYLLAMTHA